MYVLLQFLSLPTPTPPPPIIILSFTVQNSRPYTHPLFPELRERVHNDTKHNVQSNGGYNDEERDVIEQSQPSHTPIFWDQWNYLQGQYYSFTLESYNAIQHYCA